MKTVKMMGEKHHIIKIREKKWCAMLLLLFAFYASLFMSSCGNEGGKFKIEGSFKGFSQGELYIYSTSGTIHGLDTIAVKNGKFSYQTALDTTVTYVLVFPNFSEIPIFGASGAKVSIEGDVSHLRKIEVNGTKENELMTGFRLKTSEMTPPEVTKEAALFIKEHPQAQASLYLLNKYFIQTPTADYQQAAELINVILKASPNNTHLNKMLRQLDGLKALKDKGKLPKFSTSDIKGKPVSNVDLYAKVNVITTWAIWNYESVNIQRQLKAMEREYGANKLKIVSFCIEASAKECRKYMDRDSITWNNVCDGRLWENPALVKLGLTKVPDNIISDSKGTIIAHSLPVNELRTKIESMLK